MSEVTLESQLIEIIKDEEMAENIKLAKIDMLIRLGVDVNAMYGAKSALKLANEVNEPQIIEFIKENGAKEFFAEEIAKKLGKKIIGVCANGEKKDIKEIKELIDMGADVKAEDDYGYTALMWASQSGHKEVVELLIKNGADVNHKDNDGDTALMGASRRGYKEVAEVLIQKGADVNAENNHSLTALINASERCYGEIVELLIQNGADVNVKNELGNTALIRASKRGYEEIVELLIQNGADVNQKNNEGQNAMMSADNEKIKKAIMDAVKKRNEKENGGSFFSKIKRRLGIDM
ncbi:MAG: hypothetical protein E7005_06095 [Alphaproteobacteria bacterium]|nr:hypothetical protein [Alphaproteobacteria bacterium]